MHESPEAPAPPQHEVLVLFLNWSKVGTLLCLSECSQPQGLPFFFGEQRDEAMEAREGNNMGFVDYIPPKPYWVLIAIVSIAGKVGHFRSYGDHDRALISGGRLLPEEYVIKVGIPAPLSLYLLHRWHFLAITPERNSLQVLPPRS